jgi:hypothetical protein
MATSREFDQREYDCFISYTSANLEIAERLTKFIEACGLKVFFDRKRFVAGTEVDEGLAKKIQQSKSFLLLASSQSIERPHVKEEIRVAKNEAVIHNEFCFVVALLEDFDPSKTNPALSARSWLALPGGELTIETVRNLLLSLRRPGRLPRLGQSHVYVSCSWRDMETHPRDRILIEMKARDAFLVGDSREQRSFQEEGPQRIRRIMSGCSGFVAIYPDRSEPGKSPEELYKYFHVELEIARELGLVERIFCARSESLPAPLRANSVIECPQGELSPDLSQQISAFLDEVGTKQPHAFLATDFKRLQNRNEAARDIFQNLVGMECHLGKEVLGNDLRKQIRLLIRNANLIIADLACGFEENSEQLHINTNTCIEAGIAFAHDKPLFLTMLDPTVRIANASKTRSVPFFFRDHSIEWYRDDPGFLANIFRIALNRRRRIINDELP